MCVVAHMRQCLHQVTEGSLTSNQGRHSGRRGHGKLRYYWSGEQVIEYNRSANIANVRFPTSFLERDWLATLIHETRDVCVTYKRQLFLPILIQVSLLVYKKY